MMLGGSIEFVDARNGQPVPGALLKCGTTSLLADGSGKAEATAEKFERCAASVSHAQFYARQGDLAEIAAKLKASERVRVALHAFASVRGDVRDRRGGPVRAAQVFLMESIRVGGALSAAVRSRGTTSEQGEFAFERLMEGK